MKNLLRHSLAAAAAAAILLVFYKIKELYPFGGNTVAWCDMNQQVIPLLCAFQDAVKEGSLFLSHGAAGGMNMWGVWLFFIASPFTLLTLLVEKAAMAQFMNILLLFKIMLCAVSASVFFAKKHPRLHPVFGMLLSLSYAFCGYTMLFYQNIVWLDVMALFPWLLLSLDKLFSDGDFLPYTLCLTATVAIQFYLGYMIAVFLVLAVFLRLVWETPLRLRGDRALKAAMGSFLAAMLSAVCWLPSLLQVLSSARGGSLTDSLSDGAFFTPFPTVGMLLLCTAGLLPAFVLALTDRMRDGGDPGQKTLLTLFSLLLTATVIEPVNKMWHTGSYQAFPGRYGFMLVFLGLCLTASLLQRRRGKERVFARQGPVLSLLLCGLFALLPILALWLWKTKSGALTAYVRSLWSDGEALKAFLLFFLPAAGLFSLVLCLYRAGRLSRRVMAVCMSVLVLTESFFYANCFIVSRSDYTHRAVMAMEDLIGDDSFYRVKNQAKNYDVNLTGAAGMNTLNHYTSLTRTTTMQSLRKMGYSGYWMEISSVGGDLIADRLTGQKYTLLLAEEAKDPLVQKGPLAILEDPLALSPGLICDSRIESFDDRLRERPFYNQQLLQKLSGSDFYPTHRHLPEVEQNLTLSQNGSYTQLIRTDSSKTGLLEYTILPQTERRKVYFDCFDSAENHLSEPYYKAAAIYVNGALLREEYPTQKDNGLLYLGECTDEPMRVSVLLKKDLSVRSFGVFSVAVETAETMLSGIPQADLTVRGRTVTGSVVAAEGQDRLFLSIPYDEGWSARVNGEKTKPQQVLGGWMALPLQEGTNEIALSYTPPGFWAGLCLTLAGAGLLFPLWHLFSLRRYRSALLEKLAFGLFLPLFAAVVSLVYLMPVLLWILV